MTNAPNPKIFFKPVNPRMNGKNKSNFNLKSFKMINIGMNIFLSLCLTGNKIIQALKNFALHENIQYKIFYSQNSGAFLSSITSSSSDISSTKRACGAYRPPSVNASGIDISITLDLMNLSILRKPN